MRMRRRKEGRLLGWDGGMVEDPTGSTESFLLKNFAKHASRTQSMSIPVSTASRTSHVMFCWKVKPLMVFTSGRMVMQQNFPTIIRIRSPIAELRAVSLATPAMLRNLTAKMADDVVLMIVLVKTWETKSSLIRKETSSPSSRLLTWRYRQRRPVLPTRKEVIRNTIKNNEALELNFIRKLEKINTKGITKARGRRTREETLKTNKPTSSLSINL